MDKKGFTLIEVIITIFFLSIFFGISIFALRSLQPDIQLSGTARNFITDLRSIQQRSISEQARFCIKIFSSDKKYIAMKCDESEVLYEKTLPSEIIEFTSSVFTGDKIEFNPYGSVRESGTVTFKNTEGKEKIIGIRPAGFVELNN